MNLFILLAIHYGFTGLSETEMAHLEHHTHKVVAVRHNQLGAARVHAHLQKLGAAPVYIDPAAHGEEFTALKISHAEALQMLGASELLPPAVDNSQLPCFPPIGNQQQLNSCVAWGSTYYQATHEIGLLNDLNNKSNSQGILSPKWTYNLLNGGQNSGLSPVTAYQLLMVNGAASMTSFPYDGNYTAWDLNPTDWISAIANRMAPATVIPGLGGSDPQNLTAIKQALNNGHILTFATYVDSWVYTQIKHDAQNINNLHVGEFAAYWMNGTEGGHFMTIVGYDDTLWIDVNQNNSVDPGERGAFLVANSWGSAWGNHGFIWISYDAFLAASAVPNGPSQGRVAAGAPLNSLTISAVPKEPHYSPKLIGQFSLKQALRNEIDIQAGVSDTTQTVPTAQVEIPALAYQGGAFEFDGQRSTALETATFAVDLTDLLPATSASQRYYLVCKDNKRGSPVILTQFSLIDLLHNQTTSASNLPISFDSTTITNYIDYDFQ